MQRSAFLAAVVTAWVLATSPVRAEAGAGRPPCQEQPGSRCPDGTYYIGQHPDGLPLFAAACDVGMSLRADGGCDGERSLLIWGPYPSGNPPPIPRHTTDADDSGPEDWSGREHTAALAEAGGYPAAAACAGLTMNGHTDWYLPAANELDLIWAATHTRARVTDDWPSPGWLPVPQASGTALAQTFDRRTFSTVTCNDSEGNPCNLWSSSHYISGFAWNRPLSYGFRYFTTMDFRFAARCVRR